MIEAFQTGVLLTCAASLALLAVAVLLPFATGQLRRLVGAGFLFCAMACFLTFYGGGKNIRYDTGLTKGAGTLVSNDTVRVEWTFSGIPQEATVYVDYRESGTQDPWSNLGEAPITQLYLEATLANATNYDYYVYAVYIPPTPVHTNGVWVGQAYETKERLKAQKFVIINGCIIQHGKIIATPVLKRKEDDE